MSDRQTFIAPCGIPVVAGNRAGRYPYPVFRSIAAQSPFIDTHNLFPGPVLNPEGALFFRPTAGRFPGLR